MTKENLIGNRVSWIDNLRTISIFSVVVVHTGRISEAFVTYAISFYMPVFFFISGLFVKESILNQSFKDFTIARVKRLLIPYLTFGVISYILWISIISRVKGETLPVNPAGHFLMNTLYGVSGYGWFEYNITLWFFPCLLVTELLFFFLIRLPSRKIAILTLFLFSIVGYFYFDFFNIENGRLPLSSDVALTAVVFYGIGYLARPYVLDDSLKAWYSPPFLALGLLAYVVFSNLNKVSSFAIGNFGSNYFLFYLAALSGIFFWLQCSRLIKPNRLFEEIGQNTIVIFPLHLLLFPFFTGFLVYICKIPKEILDRSNLIGLLYAIAAILMLVPVAWALNRYAPFLLGRNLTRSS